MERSYAMNSWPMFGTFFQCKSHPCTVRTNEESDLLVPVVVVEHVSSLQKMVCPHFFLSSVMVSILSFQIVVVDPTLSGTSAPQEDTIIRGKIRRPYEKHTAWIGFPFLLSSTSTRISGARLEHSLN